MEILRSKRINPKNLIEKDFINDEGIKCKIIIYKANDQSKKRAWKKYYEKNKEGISEYYKNKYNNEEFRANKINSAKQSYYNRSSCDFEKEWKRINKIKI